MDLQALRDELDQIDKEIVALYERRMELCEEVAIDKIRTGKEVLDSKREAQKLKAVSALVKDEFDKKAIQELYRQLMTVSRRLQLGVLRDAGKGIPLDFKKVESIDKQGKKVLFQGVEGAYAHIAAKKCFPDSEDFQEVETWKDGMDLVRDGKADYMVIPIENSSHGAVYANFDLILQYPELQILEEVDLRIEHALLSVKGADIFKLKKVYSHPQALGQCQEFFDEHPHIVTRPVLNTAVAAKLVADSKDETKAAIASEISASLYDLDILQRSVNTQKNNITRFLVIGRGRVYHEKASKISLVFEIGHQPGALYNILGNFHFNDVNMRMIQSRPVPDQPFEYRFFVDIEGNLSNDNVVNALNGITQEVTEFRILGCY